MLYNVTMRRQVGSWGKLYTWLLPHARPVQHSHCTDKKLAVLRKLHLPGCGDGGHGPPVDGLHILLRQLRQHGARDVVVAQSLGQGSREDHLGQPIQPLQCAAGGLVACRLSGTIERQGPDRYSSISALLSAIYIQSTQQRHDTRQMHHVLCFLTQECHAQGCMQTAHWHHLAACSHGGVRGHTSMNSLRSWLLGRLSSWASCFSSLWGRTRQKQSLLGNRDLMESLICKQCARTLASAHNGCQFDSLLSAVHGKWRKLPWQ